MYKLQFFLHLLDIVTYSTRVQKNLPLAGVQGGTAPPNLNMGPPKMSETTRGRMLKLKTQLYIVKYALYVKKNFSARWRPGGVGPASVNLGPPP